MGYVFFFFFFFGRKYLELELFTHSYNSNMFSQVVPLLHGDIPLKLDHMQCDLGLLAKSYLY